MYLRSSCCRLVFDNNKADDNEAFNLTSRYLDDFLNIDKFLTLNKWNVIFIPTSIRSIKLFYTKADHDIYISQLINFAKVCANVTDFNNRNQFSTAYSDLNKAINIIIYLTLTVVIVTKMANKIAILDLI